MGACAFCGTEHAGPSPCPSCGREPGSARAELGDSKTIGASWVIDGFFKRIWQILTHPSAFFRRMPPVGGLTGAIAFALAIQWAASALFFLWSQLAATRFQQAFQDLSTVIQDLTSDPDSANVIDALLSQLGIGRDSISGAFRTAEWFFSVSRVLLEPFFALAGLLASAALVWVGAKLLIRSPREGSTEGVPVRYETILKITAFSSAPAILQCVIPLAGSLVSSLFSFVLLVIGLQEVHRVSSGRAMVVASFPVLVFFGILMVGIVGLGLFIGLLWNAG